MKHKLKIVVQHYFPFHFIALGVGSILSAILVMLMNPWLGGLLLIIGILFTTTHHRLAIDLKKRTYREYLWIFGFKRGDTFSYPGFDVIYINEVDMASGYGYVSRINITSTYYKAYLKLADEESIFFGESKHEKKIMQKAQRLADALSLEIAKNY